MRVLLSLALCLLPYFALAQTGNEAAMLAQKQLDAYNAKNLEAFLSVYSEDVKVYNHPDQLILQGKAKMRARYKDRFDNSPDLHCTLTNRMVLGNVVIDQEYVIRDKSQPAIEVIAMYKIADGKIAEVYFIRPDKE